ncbi:hypothetical protein AB0O31_32980 [Kitasatospora cineracea]|uniref:hypothetical protein n=1 Tax=Kitasatospora cineracea TaxID=88074 RepID=UPI0034462CC8
MTRHLTARSHRARTTAQQLLEHLADAVETIGAFGCAIIFVAHFLPWGGTAELRQLTFTATAVYAMAWLGTGVALSASLYSLADLIGRRAADDAGAFGELPAADFSVYEDDFDPDDTDWALEAAVALGQLRVDLHRPGADLGHLLAGVRAAHLVREVHDVIALAADRYADRDHEQHDADQAAELREAACYLDMARMAVGDNWASAPAEFSVAVQS